MMEPGMEAGMGMTPEELKASVYEDYDLEALRAAEDPYNPDK